MSFEKNAPRRINSNYIPSRSCIGFVNNKNRARNIRSKIIANNLLVQLRAQNVRWV